MKPYRIKHVSGLYYQPAKGRNKSNLSTNGNVYLTKNSPFYDKPYLYMYDGACMVTVTGVYKLGDNYYYDIDASYYAKDFELVCVSERLLGNNTTPGKYNIVIDYYNMQRLYRDYKNNI